MYSASQHQKLKSNIGVRQCPKWSFSKCGHCCKNKFTKSSPCSFLILENTRGSRGLVARVQMDDHFARDIACNIRFYFNKLRPFAQREVVKKKKKNNVLLAISLYHAWSINLSWGQLCNASPAATKLSSGKFFTQIYRSDHVNLSRDFLESRNSTRRSFS